jgi:GntR family transcriptional regulator
MSQDVLPRHHQIYVVLRQQIMEGFYPPDQPMPGEHDLSTMFGASRITLRRALDRLENEGLVLRRRGSGTFPLPVTSPAPIRANLRGLFENLLAMGVKTKVRLIEFSYITSPADIAQLLEIPPHTVAQKAVRVRSHRGKPFSHLTTYVPEDIGRSYQQLDLAAKPLLQLLERAGVKVSRADQVITAKLADVSVAPLLELDVGAPLLCVKRQVRDQNDRIVEYIEALYRPDLYEYHMTLSRTPGSDTLIWAPEG